MRAVGLLLVVAAFLALPIHPANAQEGALITDIVFPGVEVEDVIIKYTELSGNSVIRTPGVSGTVHIVQNEQKGMTLDQALDFIRTSLFYHGVALLPHQPGIEVAVSWAGGTAFNFPSPNQSLQPVLYKDPANLPEDGSFVNYAMQLNYIGADEAAQAFSQLMPPQTGRYTPIPNAGRIIISEIAPVVRTLIAYKEQLDVPEQARENRFITLRLADAEEVATQIQDLITAQEQLRTQNSGGRVGARGAAQNLANNPQAVPVPLQGAPGSGTAAPGATQPTLSTGSGVIVQSDARTNRILLNGRKADVEYIAGLVEEFDQPAEVETLLTKQLRYFSVIDFLDVAATGLERFTSRATGGAAGGRPGGLGGQRRTSTNRGTGANATGIGAGTGFGNTGTGSSRTSRSSRGAGGGGGGAGGRLQSQQLFPESVTIDKTLLIADPRSNSIIVSGPPEHLGFITDLIEKMDVRPLQVYISAVLAQVTLGDDIQFGTDILRTVETVDVNGTAVDFAGFFRNITSGTGIIDPNTLTSVADFGNLGSSGLNAYGNIGDFLTAYIRTLQTRNDFKVLARPFVFTANNEVAVISIGERVPVPTSQQSSVVTGGTTSLNTNIDFEDVLLELEVAPLINSENEVTLTVNQINDNITGSSLINGDEIPIISTQELNTTVTVPNGGVLVIGGLISKSETKTNAGLPFITKLPMLKTLLGSGTRNTSRSELLIFIQPRVIDNSASLVAAHTDQVRRSVVAGEVEGFSQPEFDTQDLVLPTDSGDIRWKDAGYQPDELEANNAEGIGDGASRSTRRKGLGAWLRGIFGKD